MLKKILIIIIALASFAACSTKNENGNLVIKGTVKGLRLGTLHVKQFQNDSLVSIDSLMVDGNEHFEFHTQIDEPQIMALELPQVNNGRLLFFAAPNDTINIFAYVESFGIDPIVKGGVNQNRKNEFDQMMRQFSNKEMDLFKAKFDAAKQHMLKEADSLGQKLENLKIKRQLYTLNFIFRNKDYAIAPYVALNQFYNNKKALDTIYKTLTPAVQQSGYGKQLKKLLQNSSNGN